MVIVTKPLPGTLPNLPVSAWFNEKCSDTFAAMIISEGRTGTALTTLGRAVVKKRAVAGWSLARRTTHSNAFGWRAAGSSGTLQCTVSARLVRWAVPYNRRIGFKV